MGKVILLDRARERRQHIQSALKGFASMSREAAQKLEAAALLTGPAQMEEICAIAWDMFGDSRALDDLLDFMVKTAPRSPLDGKEIA